MIVDDDPTCLMILQKMLRSCGYQVTQCHRADIALSLLREKKSGFDIVISDVHMPDMDGFKLLEHIGLEMDLPVIMMSADDNNKVVMKGVTHGACDYLIKPIRIESLKTLWQHVLRKKKHENKDFQQSRSVEDGDRKQKAPEEADYSFSANEGSWMIKKRKDDEDESEDKDDTTSLKRARVVWSVELHQQFVAAVNQLGLDKAVPKKILENMNVPGLTRENVASHLQKYRIYLKRVSGQQQNGLSDSFLGTQEAPFGSMSSFNGQELQSLAASGQIPEQSLAALQDVSQSTISPLVDQGNIFSFESPTLHFVEGQQQLSSNSEQMNFLPGIPTNMEPKQLSDMHQTANLFAGMMQGNQSSSSMVPMTQQASAQIQNETNGNLASMFSSSIATPISSNGIANGVLGYNGVINNVQGPAYDQVSQPSAMDFSVNHSTDLLGNGFSVGDNSDIPPTLSTGVFQGDASMEVEGSGGDARTTYDIINDLLEQKSQDWSSLNPELTFGASPLVNMQGDLGTFPSFLGQQDFLGNLSTGNSSSSSLGQGVFLSGEENMPIVGQQPTVLNTESSFQVEAKSFPETSYQNALLPGNGGQEDLMSALLKQQDGTGRGEDEFGFDGYSMDHLPI
ncbi:two-component response regulator ARR2 isoform X3 [Daucus carota subsp. sativus]|nr:PREDICTED: two-component response regulator ARR2 isoform X3 [Daucus carota subsp. sativus]